MKKLFTLIAAALMGLCAFSQNTVPCPSILSFKLIDGSDLSQVEVELQLLNASYYLNGFNMAIGKDEAIQWKRVGINYFTANGYGKVILARLEGVDDNEREELLHDMCDVLHNILNDKLIIIELLSTLECRFFPFLGEPTGIGKFYMDMSGCDDGEYTITAENTALGCTFSFTGDGPEGDRAWTADAPVTATFIIENGVVTQERDVTGISTIATDNADNRIFDLQGHELNGVPESGIYIQNGKKYVK